MAERFAHALVIGKFYPLHSGHSALIRAALRASDRVTVQVLGSSVETIPLDVRAEWVGEEHPTARVVAALDDAPVDFDSDAAWQAHTELIAGLLDAPVDAVFSSDPYGEELARRLGAAWRRVDPGRGFNPVSGTDVRADLAAHWHELSPAARQWLGSRVVVLGAESTGSTTLAEALAAELGTSWVPEYGREHSVVREGGLDAPWRSDEFDLIVDRQIELERRALRTMPTPVLVCDTDVLATALWHERYVGAPAPRLLSRARSHRPVLYVLTGDEIPFVQDGMRDGEHIRHAMQERFRVALAESAVPWIEVRGDVPTRVAAALPAIRTAVAQSSSFALPLEARPWAEQVALEAAARTAG
ncbi:NadR type nicotinamide-nucleotide adenylyltransferase [Microbacterium sp. AG1240]|uniref:AAA family ATPase n=1 Tax=Microbacterium sp. AG1240 TaxID=2183992 RepID=UPI000EB491EC|nr:AAA family ATPase [Microbacterium sp. AG1240]RKT33283.1 NadR type nicotinamide-nucleotide adenylyltransferase [Microbacterium sp. AG1240]